MTTSLITEFKQQWPMLILGWCDRLSELLVSLISLQLALVDGNPFRPCVASVHVDVTFKSAF